MLSVIVILSVVMHEIVVQSRRTERLDDGRRGRRGGRVLVRHLVDDGYVAYRGPPGPDPVLVSRSHGRLGFGQQLGSGQHDYESSRGRGHQDRQHAHHEDDLAETLVILVRLVDLVEDGRTQGGLDRSLGHASESYEDLLLEVQVGAYADERGDDHAEYYAGQEDPDRRVDDVALELGQDYLGSGHPEQQRLEQHPENLEGHRHWILKGQCWDDLR